MQISDEFNTIVAYAREEAMRTGCYAITPDHLFLGILRHPDCRASVILLEKGIDPNALRKDVESVLFREKSIPYNEEEKVSLDRDSANVLNKAMFEAVRTGSSSADSRHLLMAICQTSKCRTMHVLASFGIDYDSVSSGFAPVQEKAPEEKTPAKVLGTFSVKAPEIYS
ncbi:MAG: hypothetical protein MJY61_01125 [Bacteroidales bacterium]|nr:hypothetical protein [Bacteroidales bacterium]